MKYGRFSLLMLIVVFFTADRARAQMKVYEFLGWPDASLGGSVAGVGDVDGDGYNDIAVGMPTAGPSNNHAGRVQVYSGLNGSLIRTYLGQAAGDNFGHSLDGIGDIDGDGLADFVVGAPYADTNGFTNNGRAYAVAGGGGLLYYWDGGASGNMNGWSVAGLGDVTGDGVGDYAMGAPWADANGTNSGAVFVISGANHFPLPYKSGAAAGDLFGFSIDGVGDINQDGRADYVVGAPTADLLGSNFGKGYVYSGFSGKVMFEAWGQYIGGQLGFSVGAAGDVNGDGIGDVIFGAPVADPGGTDSGQVLVLSGKVPHPILHDIAGVAGTKLGWSVAGLGDYDGDGTQDFAACAPLADFIGASDVGLVRVYSGVSGALVAAHFGSASGDQFGRALDAMGDLNKDGVADLVAGSRNNDFGGTNAGQAIVFLGAAKYPATYCTAKQNSQGCTPSIGYTGSPTVTIADDFHVTAVNVINNMSGIMIWSLAPNSVPFGGGILCLASPVRTPLQNSSGNPTGTDCSGTYDFYFSQAYMASQVLTSGSTVYCQYWSRDTGFLAPNNIGLTNALEADLVP